MERGRTIWRNSWLLVLMLGALTALELRVGYWQLSRGADLANSADRARQLTFSGERNPRGRILDRAGRNLTNDQIEPVVVVFPSMTNPPLAEELAGILNASPDEISARLGEKETAHAPVIVKTKPGFTESKTVQDINLPGVFVLPMLPRYQTSSPAAHLIGYVNSIDAATWQILKSRDNGEWTYRKEDVIGVKGIEAQYEEWLRGKDPSFYWQATADARGQIVPALGFTRIDNPSGGWRNSVSLTIEQDIQATVEQALDSFVPVGAAVVQDIATGDVLAMASRPSFDQNWPAKALASEEARDNPLLNRVLEHYFPGSVFKIVVAAAALNEGMVTPESRFFCRGAYTLPTGLTIPCWKREGHGELTFSQAMAVSCNPTFVELGLNLGREKLLDYAARFGLNKDELIGYRLPDGPSSVQIEDGGPGKVANASLGQEGVRLTPLQVAGIVGAVARGGTYLAPRVVSRIADRDGLTIKEFPPGLPVSILKPGPALELQKMLEGVTLWGTGQEAWVPGWGSAGKTSSAQTGRIDRNGQPVTDAWFAGYAPLDQPRYAVSVVVEGGASGGQNAAPVFRQIVMGISQIEAARAAGASGQGLPE